MSRHFVFALVLSVLYSASSQTTVERSRDFDEFLERLRQSFSAQLASNFRIIQPYSGRYIEFSHGVVSNFRTFTPAGGTRIYADPQSKNTTISGTMIVTDLELTFDNVSFFHTNPIFSMSGGKTQITFGSLLVTFSIDSFRDNKTSNCRSQVNEFTVTNQGDYRIKFQNFSLLGRFLELFGPHIIEFTIQKSPLILSEYGVKVLEQALKIVSMCYF